MPFVPYTYKPDEDFGDDNWQEAMGTLKPGGPGVYSTRNSEEVLVGLIESKRAEAAVRYCLGYSWTNDGTYSINRVPPIRHPIFDRLYCTSATIQLRTPAGNTDNPQNQPYLMSAVDGAFSKYGKYLQADLVLKFGVPDFNVLADDEVEGEWERWTYMFDVTPSLELLAVDGRPDFQFAEGPAGPPKPVNIDSSVSVRKDTVACVCRWYQVPVDYLSEDGYIPFKLASFMGKVNSKPMFDGLFPAGTVYLDQPKIDYYQLPIKVAAGSPRPWVCDVQLPFNYFNPETGISQDSFPGPLFLGWNLHPYMASEEDARWFAATRNGLADGARTIAQADLMQVFTHWNT